MGYMGIKEKSMETTIIGYIGVMRDSRALWGLQV